MNNDYASLTNGKTLAANRAGMLTDEQRAEYARQTRGCGWLAALLLLVFGGGVLALAFSSAGLFNGSGVAWGSLVCGSPVLLIGIGLVALGFYAPFGISQQQGRMKRDLADGIVARGQGSVVFTPRGYIARMEWTQALPGGGAARWQRGRRVSLPPGRYYFYYLPLSGALLSATPMEPQRMADDRVFARPTTPALDPLAGLPGYTPASQPSYGSASTGDAGAALPLSPQAAGALQAALAEALHFTMADLAENRQGRLGAVQGRRLTRPTCSAAIFALVAIGGVATCALLGLTRFMPPMPPVFTFVFVGFLALVVLVVLRAAVLPVVDARDRRVESIEGVVRALSKTSGEDTEYYYDLGTKRFQVSYAEYVALISGLRYRVYFTPRAKRVVGIEPLVS